METYMLNGQEIRRLKQINYYNSGKLRIIAENGERTTIFTDKLIVLQTSPIKGIKGITNTLKIDWQADRDYEENIVKTWGIEDADMLERVSNVISVIKGTVNG